MTGARALVAAVDRIEPRPSCVQNPYASPYAHGPTPAPPQTLKLYTEPSSADACKPACVVSCAWSKTLAFCAPLKPFSLGIIAVVEVTSLRHSHPSSTIAGWTIVYFTFDMAISMLVCLGFTNNFKVCMCVRAFQPPSPERRVQVGVLASGAKRGPSFDL